MATTSVGARNSCSSRANDEFGCARNFLDSRVQENLNTGGAALGFEHVENRARRAVAEELAERLLVIRDAMLLDQAR